MNKSGCAAGCASGVQLRAELCRGECRVCITKKGILTVFHRAVFKRFLSLPDSRQMKGGGGGGVGRWGPALFIQIIVYFRSLINLCSLSISQA